MKTAVSFSYSQSDAARCNVASRGKFLDCPLRAAYVYRDKQGWALSVH